MKKLFLIICVAFGLVLAGCSDDGTDNTGSQVPPVSESSAPSGDEAPDLADILDDEDCQAAAAAMAAAAGGGAAATGGLPDADAAVEQLEAVAEAVPDELKDDFRVLAAAFGKYYKALKDAGVDFSDPNSFSNPAAAGAFAQAASAFTAEAQQAANNIQTGLAEICDFDAG